MRKNEDSGGARPAGRLSTLAVDRGRLSSVAELGRWLEAAKANQRDWQSHEWQRANMFRDGELARIGLLDIAKVGKVAERYPVVVSPYVLSLVDWSDPLDPIMAQWMPDARELEKKIFDDASTDPFSEIGSTPIPGLVQRFPDRVLVMASTRCVIKCRHCFRKNNLETNAALPSDNDGISKVIDFIRSRPGVREVLISGGDPLTLDDETLLRWVNALCGEAQIDAVRIGSRVPSALPMRVTAELATDLGRSGKVWLNTQFNHVREITAESAAACARLVEAGIPVSNQSVLLKGVNDTVANMEALCRGLQRIRVRPYYVFVCDPVEGTQHFRTSVAQALEIERELAARVGGLALPRFVVDKPGHPYKQSVAQALAHEKAGV